MDENTTYEEEDIPFNFGDSYNQDKLFEGYVDDDSYAEPYRYLTQWYLTSTLSNLPHRRYALPKNGRFASDHVLYGCLIPSDGERPLVKVRILLQSKTWVVDRSITLRGIWVSSGKAWYWLQEPCTRKVEVRLRTPALNATHPPQEDQLLMALLPSQVEVHLEVRALLGLLSNLCDILLHSDLAENGGLQADTTPGRYLRLHIQKKPAELWEALRCRNDEMWEQHGNDKDGIITPYEPFDLALLESHPAFVKAHMLHYNVELSERCNFIKGLGVLAKQQRGRNKTPTSWSEKSLIASAQLSEHRSQREAWGASLASGQRFQPNWVLEAQVQMAASKAAAKKAANKKAVAKKAVAKKAAKNDASAQKRPQKRKRASADENYIRKQLKRASLRKKEMPVAVFRTFESDEEHRPERQPPAASTNLGNMLYDTDEEHGRIGQPNSAKKSIRKNKISRKKVKHIQEESAPRAIQQEERPRDDTKPSLEESRPATSLSSYSDGRMRQALQLLHEFTVEYNGGSDWESLNESTDLQYVSLVAAEGAYKKMLQLQEPTPEVKLLFALLFRNSCLAKKNKMAKKPFQLKSNPAKLLFEDWRKDAINSMETLKLEGKTEELYLVTIMRCIEVCDIVKEFKQLDGLKQKKEIDWESGISETLQLANRVQSKMLVQACSAANSRVGEILSRVAAKKESTARKEAEEQAEKEEVRRVEEERRKTREVERKLAIEAVRRHSEELERKKREEANARKQKEQARNRLFKMKDLMARHSKPASCTPPVEAAESDSLRAERESHSNSLGFGDHQDSTVNCGVLLLENISSQKDVDHVRRLASEDMDLARNGIREPESSFKLAMGPQKLLPERNAAMNFSGDGGRDFDKPGRYNDPRDSATEGSKEAFTRTSYSQLADRKLDSRAGDLQDSRSFPVGVVKSSFPFGRDQTDCEFPKQTRTRLSAGESFNEDDRVAVRKTDTVKDERASFTKERRFEHDSDLDENVVSPRRRPYEPQEFDSKWSSSGPPLDGELERADRYRTHGGDGRDFTRMDGRDFTRMDVGKKGKRIYQVHDSSQEKVETSTSSYSRDFRSDSRSSPPIDDSNLPYETHSHRYLGMEQDRYVHERSQRTVDADDGLPVPLAPLATYVEIANEPRRGKERSKRYADIDSDMRGAHDRSVSYSRGRSRSRSRSESREMSTRDPHRSEPYGTQRLSSSLDTYSSDLEREFQSSSRDTRLHYDDTRIERFSGVARDDGRHEVSLAPSYGDFGTRPRPEDSKSRSSRYSSLADDDYHERLRKKNEEQLREVTRKRELDKFMAERSSYKKRLHIQSALDEGKLPYEGGAPPYRGTKDQSMSPRDGSNEPAPATRTRLPSKAGSDVTLAGLGSSRRPISDHISTSNLQTRASRSIPPKKRDNDSGNKLSSAQGFNAGGIPVARGNARGRGRGVSNLPAWMTRQGLTSSPQSTLGGAPAPKTDKSPVEESVAAPHCRETSSESADNVENSTSTEPRKPDVRSDTRPKVGNTVQNGSVGRGRGRVLPAWMTRRDGALGSAQPAQSTKPAPSEVTQHEVVEGQRSAELQPNPQPNIKFMSSGRGRGRNLPAWMTRGENLLGNAPSSHPSVQSALGGSSAAQKARSQLQPSASESMPSVPSNSGRRRSVDSQTRQSTPAMFPSARRGRGRGVSNLPAWMTRAGKDAP